MSFTAFFIFFCGVVHISAVNLKSAAPTPFRNGSEYPPFKGCGKITELPPTDNLVTYHVDLTLSPENRWNEIIKEKKQEIIILLNGIRNHTDDLFGTSLFRLIDEYMPLLTNTLPAPYRQELEGISQAANISVGEVTLFNVFYEFFSLCTSIIALDDKGNVHHGRNLDFGLFLGWDSATRNWLTTEHLKSLVIKVIFTKSGTTVFETVNFAGYIGVLTGVKKGAFSLSVDERFVLNGGYVGLAQWILGKRSQQWMGLLTREVMEKASSYEVAQKMLAKPALVAPVYFILGGSKQNQGCIITRSRHKFDIFTFAQTKSWFLVQTNYDHWQDPPFYDNRRKPAQVCMNYFGQNNITSTLYSVLSTRPVLNKLTVYTALMDPNYGTVGAWLRFCNNPCWPW